MIIDKEYALVDSTAKLNCDLRDYESEINKAARATFGDDMVGISVHEFSFIISINTPHNKINHGLLVNFGKKIAKQVSSLCAAVMRIYPNIKHKSSRQLFRCINSSITPQKNHI